MLALALAIIIIFPMVDLFSESFNESRFHGIDSEKRARFEARTN